MAVADFSAASDATAVKYMALAAVIIGIARKSAIDNGKRTLSTKRTWARVAANSLNEMVRTPKCGHHEPNWLRIMMMVMTTITITVTITIMTMRVTKLILFFFGCCAGHMLICFSCPHSVHVSHARVFSE